nr:hypothetical protein [Escherichia coli]
MILILTCQSTIENETTCACEAPHFTITGVTDGAGREFRLVLTTQAQRAEEARTSSLSSSDSSRPLSASPFPDTLPGTEYGPDRGIRLSAVWLMHDPAYPESLPGALIHDQILLT